MTYTVASFFSGIGGIDLAFSWAGFDVRLQCEIDTYCQQVLKKWRADYFPNAVIKGDIHNVTKREVGKIDVIVGGFPCQDISIAGKREGIRRGNRSGLWFELLRIIRETRPKVVLLENVAAIAVPTDDGQPAPGLIVAATLAEIGYDCIWQFVRAADVNAPHQRERWFCIAYDTGIRRREMRVLQSLQKANRASMEYPASQFSKRRITKRSAARQSQRALRGANTNDNELPDTENQRLNRRFGQPRNAAFRGYAARRRQRIVSNGGAEIVEHTIGARRKEYSQQEPIRAQQSGLKFASSRYSGASPQSRLGRTAHGLSRRVDRHNGQFPSRPNEPQHAYEPSRTTDFKENRVARIKALGNAVVPQQVYPFAVAIKAFLEQSA